MNGLLHSKRNIANGINLHLTKACLNYNGKVYNKTKPLHHSVFAETLYRAHSS